LLATLLVKRLMPRMPFMLLGLMTGFGVAFLLNHSPASWSQHVGVVGPIPSAIPPFRVPQLSWQALPDLLGLASALTIVAIGQSISIAGRRAAVRAADRQQPGDHWSGLVEHRRRVLLLLRVVRIAQSLDAQL
jgi:MFS superfamily sulfate permease-like transporter